MSITGHISTNDLGITNNARIVTFCCNDTLGTLTTAGYLNTNAPGFTVLIGDFFSVTYGTSQDTQQMFTPTISNGIITLNATAGGNTVLTSPIVNPDISIDLVSFDIGITVGGLASGGSVLLYVSSGAKQYKVRRLQANSNGTNFSGGGGDRLLQITDGTTVFSVIPATNLQTLVNSQWGVTALPNPAAASINTSTQAGASLVAKYSGGTTDYTAGAMILSGILQRVA